MRPLNQHKNQSGSAMVLVLIILSALTLICGSVMMGVVLQNRLVQRQINGQIAMDVAESGIHKALWLLSGHEGQDVQWRPRNEAVEVLENQTARITVTPDRGYLRVTSVAEVRGVQRHVDVTVGERPGGLYEQALIIGDVKYPLVVTGKNRITGDVTVGIKGVEKGFIKGKGFEGGKLVEGKIHKVEEPEMPFFDSSLLHDEFVACRQSLEGPGQNASRLDVLLANADTMAHSDVLVLNEDQTWSVPDSVPRFKTVIAHGNLTIKGDLHFSDHLEIVSDGQVVLTGGVRWENLKVYGEKGVTISGSCRVSGLFLSPDSITVREDAVLLYPSVLYNPGRTRGDTLTGAIHLADQARVLGTVILAPLSHSETIKKREMILTIDEQVQTAGVLYSRYRTVFQGTHRGCVAAGSMYLYVPPTHYVNWLKDSAIDRDSLPEEFLLPLQFSNDPKLAILRWKKRRHEIQM